MATANIINVQKYCVHDGDGIRTTIFFKGCLLSCQWCHNPESQDFRPQLMFYKERCQGCGKCMPVCPVKCISINSGKSFTNRRECTACGTCQAACAYGARDIMGKVCTVDELVTLAEQDEMFYEASGGGITLSGGEAMLQSREFLLELAQKLKKKGYNLAVDTCGHAPYTSFEVLLPYIDSFLYDVKVIDREKHKKFTGQDNELILSNLKKLSEAGAHLHIRIPLINEVNCSDRDIDELVEYLQANINTARISLLSYHSTGMDKYERVGMSSCNNGFSSPDTNRINEIVQVFKKAGFSVIQIGG